MRSARISIAVSDPLWRKVPDARALCRKAARAALRAEGREGEIAILLASDAELRALNRRFRRKDKPTNVLSFPSGEDAMLGDVALARETIEREARAARLSVADHLTHLVVHGVLHLCGHDHKRAREAARMEGLEVTILARLGVADPYGRAA